MSSCIQWLIIIIIIINEYYCSAVESNNPQEHLTTEKRKPTTVSRRLRTGISSGVRTMGTGGGHCTPQVQDLYPLYPPSQRCGLCQNFKQTTLTTRLYKVRTTNLYPPLTKTPVSQDCQRTNERLKISVLSRRLKAISDGDVMTSDGRALQTRGAAETAKTRSPTVSVRVL